MEYFLDTNVALAYTFFTDPWHDSSVTVFDSFDNLHYSFNVNKEYDYKFIEFYNEQRHFFYFLKNEIREFSDKILFTKLILIDLSKAVDLGYFNFENNKKEFIINYFWKSYKIEESISKKELLSKISNFLFSFKRLIMNRQMEFKRKVICMSKRMEQYEDILKKLSDNNIHEPDNNIILDAHHLSLTLSDDLDFITADKGIIRNVTDIPLLNINKFRNLNEFH